MSTVCLISPNIPSSETTKLNKIIDNGKSLCLITASDVNYLRNNLVRKNTRSFCDPILDFELRPEENTKEKYLRCMTAILKYKYFCIAGITVVVSMPQICHLVSVHLVGSDNINEDIGSYFMKIYDVNSISFPVAKEIS